MISKYLESGKASTDRSKINERITDTKDMIWLVSDASQSFLHLFISRTLNVAQNLFSKTISWCPFRIRSGSHVPIRRYKKSKAPAEVTSKYALSWSCEVGQCMLQPRLGETCKYPCLRIGDVLEHDLLGRTSAITNRSGPEVMLPTVHRGSLPWAILWGLMTCSSLSTCRPGVRGDRSRLSSGDK